jgi:hypothetical protein
LVERHREPAAWRRPGAASSALACIMGKKCFRGVSFKSGVK